MIIYNLFCVVLQIVRAVKCEEFKPNNLYIHSYPLPIDGEPASIEWLFVAGDEFISKLK